MDAPPPRAEGRKRRDETDAAAPASGGGGAGAASNGGSGGGGKRKRPACTLSELAPFDVFVRLPPLLVGGVYVALTDHLEGRINGTSRLLLAPPPITQWTFP